MALSPWEILGTGAGVGLVGALLAVRQLRRKLAFMRLQMQDMETQTRNARSTRDAVGQVIGSMTQRVLGPIQNIVGFGRVLEQSGTATDAQREIAHAIGDSGRQLEQILGDALGVSLSTTGSLDMEEDEVDVRELMASVARSVRSRCIRNQLKFSLLLGPDLPKTVLTDAVKLRYLLQNMINEVISTTDAGGGVTLSSARWITPSATDQEIRLSFEACGGEQAPGIQPGSPRAMRAAELGTATVTEIEADKLTLAEQFARVLGGSIVTVEGPQGGVNMHVEVLVRTNEAELAEVIQLDGYQLEGFQSTVADATEVGFFGGPATPEERLVDLVLLDQPAQ